jgi:hypothetical protein
MDLYAGIAMNVKNQQLYTGPICGICNECKKLAIITRVICEYCNGCKNKQILQNLHADIAYLKWPYGNYNRKDVGIVQCSF